MKDWELTSHAAQTRERPLAVPVALLDSIRPGAAECVACYIDQRHSRGLMRPTLLQGGGGEDGRSPRGRRHAGTWSVSNGEAPVAAGHCARAADPAVGYAGVANAERSLSGETEGRWFPLQPSAPTPRTHSSRWALSSEALL